MIIKADFAKQNSDIDAALLSRGPNNIHVTIKNGGEFYVPNFSASGVDQMEIVGEIDTTTSAQPVSKEVAHRIYDFLLSMDKLNLVAVKSVQDSTRLLYTNLECEEGGVYVLVFTQRDEVPSLDGLHEDIILSEMTDHYYYFCSQDYTSSQEIKANAMKKYLWER